MTTTTKVEKKSLDSLPDETRSFEKGKIDLANLGDITHYYFHSAGTQSENGPGDVAVIPPGHNAWVIGDEPCVSVDFTGAKDYAKKA